MFKLALVALALTGATIGYAATLLTSRLSYAQAGSRAPYASADISQPSGGYETDGTYTGGGNKPVLDAEFHRDGIDIVPPAFAPSNLTSASVKYGQIPFVPPAGITDQALALDGRQLLYGHLYNMPSGADYRWRAKLTIFNEHLARVVGGPGNTQEGSYHCFGQGDTNVTFEILDGNYNSQGPNYKITGTNTKIAERANDDTAEVKIPAFVGDTDAEYTFDNVIQVAAGNNKAKLVFTVRAWVRLEGKRNEVIVGGSSKMTIKPGSFVAAYNYANPSQPVVLKRLDGQTDATWNLE
ncbi:MAG: hypothetical protein KF754_05970 [Planctomycetes bacterium]|nr:hypothetical protein [Planctomycetota bacterium]